MRKILKALLVTIAIVASATTTLQAQNGPRWRGFSLGVDRGDSLYIIGSPFDNWWLNFAGGVRTYIGNTPDPQGYWNKLNGGARLELGKWIIPDVALSARLDWFHADTKTRFAGNNPWSDVENPIYYDDAEDGPYYPICVGGLAVTGIVTFDWTNFIYGYEEGRHHRWHLYTPFGLGVTWLYGETINQNYVNKTDASDKPVALGDYVWNKELAFTGGFMAEYILSSHLSMNLDIQAKFARGSLDDHNYNVRSGKRHMDWMPSAYVGLKYNLFKSVTKYNRKTKTSSREEVYHRFRTFGTENTVRDLWGRIGTLNDEIDKLEAKADDLSRADSAKLADLNKQLDDLSNKYDSVIDASKHPANVLDELLDLNAKLNLPATIVYYELDRYELDYNARKRLQKFAREVNALPDTLEFYIIGAADSATGSVRHNQWLSERRCEAAFNMLVDHFDVSANQLTMEAVGGIMVYEPKENNRMALIIQRTKETEETVVRWRNHKK